MNDLLTISRGLVKALMVAFITVVILSLGFMWAEDNRQENLNYCEGVLDHVWPDYKGIFEKDCLEVLTAES